MSSLLVVVRNPILLLSSARRRFLSTESVTALLGWKDEPREPIVRTETLHREQLESLFATLPTRDGPHPITPPENGAPLPYGHQLVFFNPRTPERALRADRTDPEFCPPAPFTRRMWAGGEMRWHGGGGLRVGGRAAAVARVADVRVRGLEGGRPMVFVDQEIAYAVPAANAALTERRTHVYLPAHAERRGVRPGESCVSFVCGVGVLWLCFRAVEGLPEPAFVFEYLPTPTTLFRFSALTFNAHLIHLDKHYATELEGYPGE